MLWQWKNGKPILHTTQTAKGTLNLSYVFYGNHTVNQANVNILYLRGPHIPSGNFDRSYVNLNGYCHKLFNEHNRITTNKTGGPVIVLTILNPETKISTSFVIPNKASMWEINDPDHESLATITPCK